MLKIGYHLSVAGSLDLAFDRAAAIGCTAMQIFVSNPRGWDAREPAKETVGAFRRKREETGVDAICHMPYLPNLASTNPETYEKSIRSLMANIVICGELGIRYLVTHLGSHLGKGSELGLKNVVGALDEVRGEARRSRVMVLLENQAGHTNSVGVKVEDLAWIYDSSRLSDDGTLGFCLDTCHLFAAGYDIRRNGALEEIDRVLGFSKVQAFHVNDAKFELGSGKDRHENIGLGRIGTEGFRSMLAYDQVRSKILILETPENPELAPGQEMKEIIRVAEGIRK